MRLTRILFALILFLLLAFTAEAASPSYQDFDPTQFKYTANPGPGQYKMTLSISPTNITYEIIASTNIDVTNLISQVIYATTNFFQTVFVTNQYVTFEVVSNAFFTNVTILNGNGPWILTQNGFGTNTWIDVLTVSSGLYVVGEGAPIFDLVNGDTGIGVAGFDGIRWYGDGSGLTNLIFFGVVTNQVPATNIFSGGTLTASVIGSFTGDITTPGGSYATTLKNTGTAGTYRSVTFDAQGRETSGTDPTTFAGYAISDSSANFFAALTDYNFQKATNILFASLSSPTNAINAVTAIDFSRPEETTNMTAGIAFTTLLNFNSTNYNYKIWHLINNSGANQTLTTGTGWRTDPLLRTTATTYTITNNTCVDLLVGAQINFFTNANIMIASQ